MPAERASASASASAPILQTVPADIMAEIGRCQSVRDYLALRSTCRDLVGGASGYHDKQALFDLAVQRNNTSLVYSLVRHPAVDPTLENYKSIRSACRLNYFHIVSILLSDPRVDPAFDDDSLIKLAKQHDSGNVLKLLYMYSTINPSADKDVLFEWACRHGFIYIVERMLSDPNFDPSNLDTFYNILSKTCMAGQTDIVKRLLLDSRIDPTASYSQAFRVSCPRGKTEIVKALLLDGRSDPNAQNGAPLVNASGRGHVEIVRLLLSDPRIDPTVDDYRAIQVAVELQKSATEIVSLLLSHPKVKPSQQHFFKWICIAHVSHRYKNFKILVSDPKFDPSHVENKRIIIDICSHGHSQLVQYLLFNPRVDPTAHNNAALLAAISARHVSIIKLLLLDPRVDPSNLSNILVHACIHGGSEIVMLLLSDPRIDPAANDNEAIQAVCSYAIEMYDIVKILLSNPRVDPSANNNAAFRFACQKNFFKTCKALLADPRVDPTVDNNAAFQYAFNHDATDMVKLLIADRRVERWVAYQSQPFCNVWHIEEKAFTSLMARLTTSKTILMQLACFYGFENLVENLLQDSGVDPSADNHIAFRYALKRKNYKVIRLLLSDSRVDPCHIFKCTPSNSDGFHDTVEQILTESCRVTSHFIRLPRND